MGLALRLEQVGVRGRSWTNVSGAGHGFPFFCFSL